MLVPLRGRDLRRYHTPLWELRKALGASLLSLCVVAGAFYATPVGAQGKDLDAIAIPSPPPSTAFPAGANGQPELAIPGTAASAGQFASPSSAMMDASTLTQAAESQQLQAQAAAAKRERDHNRQSYDRASAGLLPLSPDQVRDFMHKMEDTQDASQAPYAGPPKGQVRVSTLSLDPGIDPPQVHLDAGYVTTITLVDATGEPWPILDVGVGGNFEVTPTQAGSHVVRIMPLTRVGTGDLSILLKDLSTPVIFRLSSGGPDVDLRYDARLPKFGPNAKVPLINRPRLEAGNEEIMMVLQNAPPKDAKRMKVSGLDARTMVWSVNDHVYVRTPLMLLSPAWNASVSSADGMTVYEIGDAPVLLMSDNGAVVRGRLLRDETP